MKIRKWMKRMVILDLFMLGLLFLTHFRGDAAGYEKTAARSRQQTDLADGEKAPAAAAEETEFFGNVEAAALQNGNRGRESALWTDGDGTKRIALTFDDGPHPRYTEKLLDGLKERGVHVTFFVTGANAEKYPEIVKRMQEEGHLIGNHTYHHVQLTAANGEQFRNEIISTNEAIRGITGEDTEYIRPPYGSWNKKYEEELDMFPVLWTVDPRDWCSDDAACIVRNTVEKIKDNDIILMHDQYKSSVTAALEIVDELQKEGYEFVTVEEILFD